MWNLNLAKCDVMRGWVRWLHCFYQQHRYPFTTLLSLLIISDNHLFTLSTSIQTKFVNTSDLSRRLMTMSHTFMLFTAQLARAQRDLSYTPISPHIAFHFSQHFESQTQFSHTTLPLHPHYLSTFPFFPPPCVLSLTLICFAQRNPAPYSFLPPSFPPLSLDSRQLVSISRSTHSLHVCDRHPERLRNLCESLKRTPNRPLRSGFIPPVLSSDEQWCTIERPIDAQNRMW